MPAIYAGVARGCGGSAGALNGSHNRARFSSKPVGVVLIAAVLARQFFSVSEHREITGLYRSRRCTTRSPVRRIGHCSDCGLSRR